MVDKKTVYQLREEVPNFLLIEVFHAKKYV